MGVGKASRLLVTRLLGQFLLGSKHIVKEVNPAKVEREREKAPHSDKSDPQDAFCISKVLVDELFSLPDARENGSMVAIRDLVNHLDIRESTRVKNRLHVLLHQMYPFYKKMFSKTFSKSATGFWGKFPHPSMLAGVDEKELAAHLRKWSKGRVSHCKAEKILDLVSCSLENKNQKPSQLELVRCRIIKSLLREFNLLEEEIGLVKEKLEELVENAGYKLRTMPGVDFTTEVRIISIIEDTDRFSSGAKIAKFCGIAPL